MTPSVLPTGSKPSETPVTSAAPAANPAVTKDMFLKLLVAQIKHQDPLNPADGVQFLTQLAQFTQVEQTLGMSTDLAAIRADLDQLVSPSKTNQP